MGRPTMWSDRNRRGPLVLFAGLTLSAIYVKSGILDNLDPSSALAFAIVWLPCAVLIGWGITFVLRRWRG